jgi:hypothetical protein
MFSDRLNKYRTYSEQVVDKNGRRMGATLGLRYGKSGDGQGKYMRSLEIKREAGTQMDVSLLCLSCLVLSG